MKLQPLSDLHTEFEVNHPMPDFTTDADVVVLAGDIGNGSAGVKWARKTFRKRRIVKVLGNHDFYGRYWQANLDKLRRVARDHDVDLLENDEVVIGGVRFLGATLWTDFEYFGKDLQRKSMDWMERCFPDYRAILRDGGRERLKADDVLERHQATRRWLTEKLMHPAPMPTVVVSHHLPHHSSVEPRFANSISNVGFVSNLDELLQLDGAPSMWIHGHTHSSIDRMVHRTRIVCNPRGYRQADGSMENLKFNPKLVIDVPVIHA